MILRRVMEHVKTQNWTAVALDFVIVVTGVFIGLQVSNWNTARVTDGEAADLLARLRVEAEDTRGDIAAYIDLNELILGEAKRLAVRLSDNETCLAMNDEMKALIFSVGDFPPPRFSLSSANEALESGRLSLIGSAEIRESVREMADQMAFMDRQWQRYVRVKQDTEKVVYTAAGLSLTTVEELRVQPGADIVTGLEQFAVTTPDAICGNTEAIALVSNAAFTQHIYTIYVRQVADQLNAYVSALAGRSTADLKEQP